MGRSRHHLSPCPHSSKVGQISKVNNAQSCYQLVRFPDPLLNQVSWEPDMCYPSSDKVLEQIFNIFWKSAGGSAGGSLVSWAGGRLDSSHHTGSAYICHTAYRYHSVPHCLYHSVPHCLYHSSTLCIHMYCILCVHCIVMQCTCAHFNLHKIKRCVCCTVHSANA